MEVKMTELSVRNMTCGHCVSAVTRAVKALDSQAGVQVDLQTGRVRIEGRSSAEALIRALDEAGYPASLAAGAQPAASKKGGCCCV
jgi:copper chaperone